MVSIKLKNMECVALCMVTSVQHKYKNIMATNKFLI